MDENRTTVAVQGYLDELAHAPAGAAPAGPIVRALLGRAVARLHQLCAALLYRSYPRLTRPPLNLQSEELLSAVVERLLKAMRQIHPQTVRQFFALANQHMRWELNDLARRFDERSATLELREYAAPAISPPPDAAASDEGSAGGGDGGLAGPNARRILDAIEDLPEDEREVFGLVRVQGMTHAEAAQVLGCSPKTVQRRLNRGLLMLSERLGDLRPAHGATTPAQTRL